MFYLKCITPKMWKLSWFSTFLLDYRGRTVCFFIVLEIFSAKPWFWIYFVSSRMTGFTTFCTSANTTTTRMTTKISLPPESPTQMSPPPYPVLWNFVRLCFDLFVFISIFWLCSTYAAMHKFCACYHIIPLTPTCLTPFSTKYERKLEEAKPFIERR